MNDPKALNMNGGQTVHGGQIGETINNHRPPVYYGKRMIGKRILKYIFAFMVFSRYVIIQ